MTDWLAQLFSTEPADRSRAEAAVRDLFRAAGFEPPRYQVWFDSPFEASWTVALLIAPHSALWRQTLEAARSAPALRKMEQARAQLCQSLAEPDWAGALAAAGAPIGSCWTRPGPGFTPTLQSALVSARMRIHQKAAALAAAFDNTSGLYQAESRLRASGLGSWLPSRIGP